MNWLLYGALALGVLLALGELAFQPHPNHRFILDLVGRLGEDDHGDSNKKSGSNLS